MTVLAIDVGGSGSRLAVLGDGETTRREELGGARVAVGPTGSSVPEVVAGLLAMARETWPDETAALRGIGIGATGMGTLVADPGGLVRSVRTSTGVATAVASDAVTAHLGALGGEGGAVVVLGTGAVAVAHGGPHGPRWRRVDGWGHLLGDRGSGARIGLEALEAALRTYDGVDDAGAGMLDAARQRFGEPGTWPAQLYTRPDRAGVAAAFAADVVALAGHGDLLAHRIVTCAGADAARNVLAALGPGIPPRVTICGGLAAAHELVSSFRATVTTLRPDVEVVAAAGDPLDGALALADLVADGAVEAQETFVWT